MQAACTAVTSLYGINRHSGGRTRINVGNFFSDNSSNVISDFARFELDIRAETTDVLEDIVNRAKQIVQGTANMFSVESSFDILTEIGSSKNSLELVRLVAKLARDYGFKDNDIIEDHFVNACDDATFLMNKVLEHGGLVDYFAISCPTKGGHHNPLFDFDEDSMLVALELLFNMIKNIPKRTS